MQIIPAIYILDGRCVALYKGSYEQKESYEKSPLNVALHFEKAGAKTLHIVDLDSLKAGHFLSTSIIQKIISSVKIPVQLEASYQTLAELKTAFAWGAAKVIIRPFALQLIPEAINTFGAEKIIVEIQSKGSGVVGGGKTSDGSPIDVVDFAEKLVPLGVREIIYKDERSEGTLIHPNYDEVDRLFLITGKDLKIYASGGIAEPRHLALLKKIGGNRRHHRQSFLRKEHHICRGSSGGGSSQLILQFWLNHSTAILCGLQINNFCSHRSNHHQNSSDHKLPIE